MFMGHNTWKMGFTYFPILMVTKSFKKGVIDTQFLRSERCSLMPIDDHYAVSFSAILTKMRQNPAEGMRLSKTN